MELRNTGEAFSSSAPGEGKVQPGGHIDDVIKRGLGGIWNYRLVKFCFLSG